MSRSNLTQRGLVGMALVLFLGSGFAAATTYWVQKNDYVAIVGGERQSHLGYQHRLLEVKQMLRGTQVPEQQAEEIAYNQLIERALLLQEARRRQLTVSDAEVDTEWERVLTSSYSGKIDRMSQDLRRSHYSPADFRLELRERLLMRRLQDTFTARTTVPETELRLYYQQHLSEFRQPERIEASHILIKADEAKPEQVKSARAKAEQLLKQIQGGASFEALAKKHSEDGTSAPNSGKLEPFAKGDMMPSFEAAAWKLKPGEVHPAPVQTIYGWHLIRRGPTRPAGVKAFAEARKDFEPMLLAQQKQKSFQQWLAQQRRSVSVIRHPKHVLKSAQASSGSPLPAPTPSSS